jgi:hypothetical protein
MTPATWPPGRKAARLLPAAAGKRCKRAGSEEGAEKIGRPGGGAVGTAHASSPLYV